MVIEMEINSFLLAHPFTSPEYVAIGAIVSRCPAQKRTVVKNNSCHLQWHFLVYVLWPVILGVPKGRIWYSPQAAFILFRQHAFLLCDPTDIFEQQPTV
jgi:ABC-type uncharacterized transport system permease subunit